MKILVLPDDQVSDKMFDKCSVVLTLADDHKSFTIERQIALSNTRKFMKQLGYKRHISALKHILLAHKNTES